MFSLGLYAASELLYILEEVGYRIENYNLEKLYSSITQEFEHGNINAVDVIKKLSTVPDCAVYNNGRHLNLLHITFLNEHDLRSVKLTRSLLERSLEYWNDVTLVFMIPRGDYFYVKDVCEITNVWLTETCGNDWKEMELLPFDLTNEGIFKRFADVFTNVDKRILRTSGEKLKRLAAKL